MRMRKSLLSGLMFSGFGLVIGGCYYQEPPPRTVYRERVVREYPPEPPRERVVERDVVVDEGPQYEAPPVEVVTTYERDLAPYGEWVVVGGYGRCWRPRVRPAGWRPYSYGTFVSTDAGWSWESDERERDWGVVTYHYGRWFEDSSYGWVWLPGTTWGPAWVAWREGGGYCGWYPLHPRCGMGTVIDVRYVDRYCPRDRFVYCDERYITEPRVHEHFVRGNVTIINQTTNITNITVVNNRVVNHGVSVAHVEERSGHHVEQVSVTHASSFEEAKRMRAEGRAVAFEPDAIKKADNEYRARVDRRAAEAVKTIDDKNARAQRRATDATIDKQQESERAQRRSTDASLDKNLEHQRVERRATEGQPTTEAERAQRRATDVAVDKDMQNQRAQRRATDDAKAKEDEVQRAQRRTADAQADKDAARVRANQRAVDDAKRTNESEADYRARVQRRAADDAAAKDAEKSRTERRATDAAKSKDESEAEYRARVQRRAAEEAAAKDAASSKSQPKKSTSDKDKDKDPNNPPR
jgi:hypothetical protein